MSSARPPPVVVWRAIGAYLAVAYDGPPPIAVRDRLSRLRALPDSAFYDSDVFERSDGRLALRLGNRHYAHMKLVLETPPAGLPHFRADTHDRHVFELLGSSDPGLAELLARNEVIARAIEARWTACGLPTYREHWRDEFARWRASRT